MQAGHGKKMKGAGLLKWFLDVFGSLVAQTECNSADEILHVRRIVQTTTKHILHPGTRFLRGAQNRIANAVSNEDAIFRVANKQTSTHVATREIRPHIEFAGVARRHDWLGNSKKVQLITECRFATPAHKQSRIR